MPPKLWLVAVGKAIGTEDSILIVVTEAAPKIQLYKQLLQYMLLHYFTSTFPSQKETKKLNSTPIAAHSQYVL